MSTQTSRSIAHSRFTNFLIPVVAACVVIASSASSVLAQGTPASRAISIAEGPVSSAQREAWEATITQAGLVSVPGNEVDAALQFSPPANGDAFAPESVDALRKSMGAALAFAVSVKLAGANYMVRVVLNSDQGTKQKFASLPLSDLQTGVGNIISALIAEHRGQAPAPVAAPVPAPVPTAVPVPAPVPTAVPVAQPVVGQPVQTVATVGGQGVPPPVATEATASATTTTTDPTTVAAVAGSAADEEAFTRGKIKIGGSGVFVVPTGDFAEGVSMGIGALITGTYEYAPNIQLSARVGLLYFALEADDATLLAMPIWAGARYYLKPNRESLFIHGEAGINDFYSKFGDATATQLTYAVNATVGKKFGKYMVEGGVYLSDFENVGSVTMFGASAGTTF